MSRISEFEPRRRDYERAGRRSWPGSAWFALGTMVVLNLLLLAFIVKTELQRPEADDESAPAKIELPKTAPLPEAQPTNNPAPDQSLKPEVAAPEATKAEGAAEDANEGDHHSEARSANDQDPEIEAPHSKPRQATSGQLHKPKIRTNRRFVNAIPGSRVAPRYYRSEPVPQSRFAAPQSPVSRVPGVPAVAAPFPSPSSGTFNTPPSMVASVRTPTVQVGNNGDTGQKVIAPKPPEAKKAQPVLIPKTDSNGMQTTKVASVSLPGMDKGLVVHKLSADSTSPKIQIIHRPPEPKVDVPNCGGEVVIPCPTLHKRPTGGPPEGERW